MAEPLARPSKTDFFPTPAGKALTLAAITAGYFLLLQIAAIFPNSKQFCMSVWPAGGFGLAVLLLNDRRMWKLILPLLFLSGMSANLISGKSFALSFGFMTANVLESFISAWVFQKIAGRNVRFDTLREYFALAVCAVAVNGTTALIASGAASILNGLPFWNIWITWFIADGLGLLLVTPLMITTLQIRKTFFQLSAFKWMEGLLFFGLWLLETWVIFNPFSLSFVSVVVTPYVLFVIMLWACFRFSPWTVSLALFTSALLIITSNSVVTGPLLWGGNDYAGRLMHAELFIAILSVSGFFTMAAISEMKKSRESLKSLALRNQTLLQTASDGMHILDDQGWIQEVNETFCKMLGYTREEMLRLNVADWDMQWSGAELTAKIDEFIRKPTVFETRHRRKDGSAYDTEINAVGVKLDGVSYLYCAARDITERKKTEEAVRRSERNLKMAQKIAHIGSWTWNTKTNLLSWSDEMYRIFGVDREGFSGDLSEVVTRSIHPDDRAAVEASNRSVVELGVPVPLEYRVVRPDGSIRVVWAEAGEKIYDEAGAVELLSGIVQDITERKKTEDQLNQLNTELESRVQSAIKEIREKDHMLILQSRQASMGEMLGNIAHQWRQPLNSLGLMFQNLHAFFEQGTLDQQKMDRYQDKALSLIQHMSQTITDFRNYFKPEREKQNFPVGEIIRKTCGLVETSLQNENISLCLEFEQDCLVTGYSNEFGQVLINLINNARDAIIERSPESRKIVISATVETDLCHVQVSDDAGGIPEALLDRIFDPYFTTKDTGTGIGLFMSKMVIENQMGGKLSAANTPQGAKFTIELKAARPAVE